jgi:ABC-2 type transport system permease protein
MLKLVKIFFLNSLKLNSFRLGDKRAKMWGFAALMVFAAVSCLFTVGQYAYGIASVGLSNMILPLFMSAASLVSVFSALFSSKNVLFGFRDYDLQASLPIKHSQIIASRFFILYVYELLLTAVMLVPGAVVYSWYVPAGARFIISFIITLFFIPLIPLTLGAVLGGLAGLLASRFRRSGFIQTILLLIFTLGLVGLSWASGSGINAEAVNALYESISRRWPPVVLYNNALGGDILSLLAFIAVSILVFILFSVLTGRWYNKINTAVTAVHTRGNYKVKTLKTRGVVKTLIYRELKAYFGSTIWVFNTAFGIVILIGLSVASLFFGRELLVKLGEASDLLLPVMPLAICFMVCMSNISCSSVSMEGGKLWIVKSLPVSEKTVLLSKMSVNFLLTAPVCVFSAVLLCVSLKPGLMTGIYLFLTPFAYCLFVAPFGLAVNLLLPKLEWTSDTQVIKQSASVMVAIFGGMAVSGIPLALCYTFNPDIVLLCATLAAVLAGGAMLIWLNRAGVKLFKKLS